MGKASPDGIPNFPFNRNYLELEDPDCDPDLDIDGLTWPSVPTCMDPPTDLCPVFSLLYKSWIFLALGNSLWDVNLLSSRHWPHWNRFLSCSTTACFSVFGFFKWHVAEPGLFETPEPGVLAPLCLQYNTRALDLEIKVTEKFIRLDTHVINSFQVEWKLIS